MTDNRVGLNTVLRQLQAEDVNCWCCKARQVKSLPDDTSRAAHLDVGSTWVQRVRFVLVTGATTLRSQRLCSYD